jgi:anti-anti-sigma regulatory factor
MDAPAAVAPPAACEPAPAPAATSSGPLRLDSDLRIRNIADASARLGAALGGAHLALDAADVVQIDTAGLQLLVATVATARRNGVACEWTGVSPCLRDASRMLGLEEALGLPAGA